jgi:hypothetical protein
MLPVRFSLAAGLLLASCGGAFALTDEIQVYTGDVAAPGVINLTLHDNYTPDGIKTPDFPGGLVDNNGFSGVAEWAYGVTPWFEAGLYLPLYAVSDNKGLTFNGFKLRTLFVNPDNATSNFYYGVNFEFSWNETHWDQQINTGEIRPIIGYHFGPVSLTVNPILDNNYKGVAALDFAPATRLDYTINPDWTIAVEEYDDFGELRGFMPANQQSHQLFAVFDHPIGPWSVEGGVGFGLTKATDNVTFKLILSRDLTGENGIWK